MQSNNVKQQDKNQQSRQQKDSQIIKQKHALKQQAKQTLLKQCYKMAMNKYLRLIGMGSQGFKQRQWSVIHLNTAICMQFQNKLHQALQKVNESIKIDPKYEKAYYRRLQILDELGHYEIIFHDNIVPAFVKNAQIQKLQQEIKQKYRMSVGLQKLQIKIADPLFWQQIGGQTKMYKFVDESYRNIFTRITQQIDNYKQTQDQPKIQQNKKFIQRTSNQINNHYCFLMDSIKINNIQQQNEKIKNNLLGCFYQHVHQICLKYAINSNKSISCILLEILLPFWRRYIQNYLSKLNADDFYKLFTCKKLQQPQQRRKKQILITYCPAILVDYKIVFQVINTVNKINIKQNHQSMHNFIKEVIKFVYTNKCALAISKIKGIQVNYEFDKNLNKNFTNIIDTFIEKILQPSATLSTLDVYTELQMLSYSLISFYYYFIQLIRLKIHAKFCLQYNAQQLQTMLYRVKHQLMYNSNSQTGNSIKTQDVLAIVTKQLVFSKKNYSFSALYLCYTTIHSIKANQLKSLKQKGNQYYNQLQQCLFQITSNMEISLHKKQPQNYVKYMLLVNMMGHLNPIYIIKFMQNNQKTNKNSKNQNYNNQQQSNMKQLLLGICKIQKILPLITSGLSQKSIRYLIPIYLQTLTTLAVSHPIFLCQILKYPQQFSDIYQILYGSPKIKTENEQNIIQTMHLLSNSIKLLFSLIVDISAQQEIQFAEKMGVTRQQVSKARQLQGQNRDTELLYQISKRRQAIINHVLDKQKKNKQNSRYNWQNIIQQIIQAFTSCQINQKDNNNILNGMAVAILLKFAEKQPNKFYAPSIINFMLACFQNFKPKYEEKSEQPAFNDKTCYNVCLFFSNICKKCNSNIFPYQKLQSIANCLIYLIKTGKHELHIFQSFLSLINLSVKNIQIPLQIIEIGLLQENQYILHGSLQLLNNILVNTDYTIKKNDKYWSKLQKLQQITYKYFVYFREIITESKKQSNQQQVNIKNYSHPYKIYCTLLSVLMVLKTVNQAKQQQKSEVKSNKLKIQQFQQWASVYKILKEIDKNKGDISFTLFKMVLHHVENKTLPSGWYKGLQSALEKLKIMDIQKWNKINKYVK